MVVEINGNDSSNSRDNRPTEEAFEFDVGSDEVVHRNVSFFVAVAHHDSVEGRIAHTQPCTHANTHTQ